MAAMGANQPARAISDGVVLVGARGVISGVVPPTLGLSLFIGSTPKRQGFAGAQDDCSDHGIDGLAGRALRLGSGRFRR